MNRLVACWFDVMVTQILQLINVLVAQAQSLIEKKR